MKRTAVLVAVFALCAGSILWFAGRPERLFGQAGIPEIILYSEEGFTGRAVRIQGTLLDLPTEKNLDGSEFNWNDKARSLVVLNGTWRLYQHGRLNTALDDTPIEEVDVLRKAPALGWSAVISATSAGPLEIPDLAAVGLGGDISSLELISTTDLPDWAFVMRGR